MKSKSKDSKYMGPVKVGPKGQIVIPKEVRDMFGIEYGDTLVLLADSHKGIAIERMGIFSKIADAILSGRGKEIYPENSEEDSLIFAKEIKKISKDGRIRNDSHSNNQSYKKVQGKSCC